MLHLDPDHTHRLAVRKREIVWSFRWKLNQSTAHSISYNHDIPSPPPTAPRVCACVRARECVREWMRLSKSELLKCSMSSIERTTPDQTGSKLKLTLSSMTIPTHRLPQMRTRWWCATESSHSPPPSDQNADENASARRACGGDDIARLDFKDYKGGRQVSGRGDTPPSVPVASAPQFFTILSRYLSRRLPNATRAKADLCLTPYLGAPFFQHYYLTSTSNREGSGVYCDVSRLPGYCSFTGAPLTVALVNLVIFLRIVQSWTSNGTI